MIQIFNEIAQKAIHQIGNYAFEHHFFRFVSLLNKTPVHSAGVRFVFILFCLVCYHMVSIQIIKHTFHTLSMKLKSILCLF